MKRITKILLATGAIAIAATAFYIFYPEKCRSISNCFKKKNNFPDDSLFSDDDFEINEFDSDDITSETEA